MSSSARVWVSGRMESVVLLMIETYVYICVCERYDGETTVEVDEVDTEGEELSRTDSLVMASVSKADPVATSFASGYELSFEADTDDKSTPRAPKQQHNAEETKEAV